MDYIEAQKEYMLVCSIGGVIILFVHSGSAEMKNCAFELAYAQCKLYHYQVS